MSCLGLCYESGCGVEENLEKAVELYRRSAELGNAEGQCNLGVLYRSGCGVAQDAAKAVAIYSPLTFVITRAFYL